MSIPSVRAQIAVVTPYPAVAGNLTRGSIDTTLLTVQVTFGAVCNGVTATITLPSGINYVPGSVTKTAGTSGTAITYSSGTPGAPVFSITGITSSGDITFTIKRVALCGITGAGKDVVSVSGSCGAITESNANINSYTIYAPSLSITAPASINNASVGGTAARNITITNGGNGCLDTFNYYAVLPAGKLAMVDSPTNTIMVNLSGGALPAAAFVPVSRVGDTLFYKIYGANAFGADNKLCNGEIVNVAESVSVKACGSYITYYGAYWGRNNSNCQQATGNAVITTSNTAAAFTTKVTLLPAASGCISPVYSVSDSLTNTGTVGVYYNKFTIVNSVTASNGYIDTASVMIAIPGFSAYHPSGGFTVNSVNTNTTACITGKPQNITYLFPAEFILPAGAKMAITYNVFTGCRDSTSCSASYTAASYTVTHTYHLLCDATLATKASSAQAFGYTMKMNAFTFQMPAVISNNATFVVKVPVAFTIPTSPAGIIAKRYGEVTLTVPSGVSLVSASDILDPNTNVYSTSSGNVITFRFIPNVTTKSHYVVFNLRNDSACGYQPLVARASIRLDSTCSADMMLTASQCYSYTTKYICPSGTVVCAGINLRNYAFGRLNFGVPDNNQDGRPDGSGSLDFTKVDPDRYMVGDTLHSVSSGMIAARGAAPLDTFAYVYGEWNFPVGAWSPAGSATITVRRGSTTYTCNNVTISTLTAGKIFRADWKSNACISGFISYRDGDSVSVTANFRLSDATYIIPAVTPNEVGGKNGTVYDYSKDALTRLVHLLYASNTAAPPTGGNIGGTGATAGFTCDTAMYNAYLTGWKHSLTSAAATATGCTAVTKSFTSQTSTNNVSAGGQYFTAEYRPIAVPDTFIVTLPTGWDYVAPVASVMTYTTKRGSTSTATYTIIPIVSLNSFGKVQLLFDYAAAFQNSTIPFMGTEGVTFTNNYSIRPSSCATPVNSKDSVTEFGHLTSSFGVSFLRYTIYSTPANTMVYSTRPSLTVGNSTGVITANVPNNAWDIQINTNALAASNVWLALEKGSGTVTVDSVAWLNAGGTATTGIVPPASAPTSYSTGGNLWYQVTPSIAANGNQKLRVYFRYANCTADSIKAYAGFDCNGYPASPASPACASTLSAIVYLKVLSRPSEIQLSIARQPGNGSAINLCSTDSATFIVNSAQPANITSPRVQVFLPTGMSVITPFPVEFPLGSNLWQDITPTIITGGYEIDLTAHTGIGSAGLKGTATNPGAAGRQAKVKVAFNTGCSYRSGSNVVMYGYANRTCGSPAVGDGTNVKTLPLDIIGIPSGGGSINMAMSLPVTTISCGGTATLSLVSIPLGSATQVGDSVFYTLPSGIGYAGNFVADSNCTGCSVSTVPGQQAGTTDVKVKLPPSMPVSTRIKYSFDLSGSGGGCGSSTIEANAVRTYPGVYCGPTLCASSESVVGSSVSGNINRIKPDLVVTALLLQRGSFLPGQTVDLRFDYRNNGGMDAAGNIYQAEFFRSGDSMPFATRTMQRTVVIGNSVSDTFSVMIPATANIGEIISAKLQPVMNSGTSQCMCAASMASISEPLPVTLLDFKAMLHGRAVTLDWTVATETGIASYMVERSADAEHFLPIGIMPAKNQPGGDARYTLEDESLPPADKLYYRLRISEKNGTFSFSRTAVVQPGHTAGSIVVIPNPANNTANVQWISGQTSDMRLQVFNTIGKCVVDRMIAVREGANIIPLTEAGRLPGGNYILRISGAEALVMHGRFTVAH